jgi:putative membrane-bound dehydrogenase-like protein
LIAAVLLAPLSITSGARAIESEAKPVPLNLALDKPATASGSQAGHDPADAVDGDASTRWCAADAGLGYWWQVDLGKREDLTGCQIHWESGGGRYEHRIEGSADGNAWSMLVDATAVTGDATPQHQSHAFRAAGVRFVRVTVTGLRPGSWASFFEFEVYGRQTVDPATAAARKRAGLLREIKTPDGLRVTVFAAPPDVAYPVCLAAALTGEVFVAVDANGSLDQKTGRGKIIRCRDLDGDGVADEFKTFAEVDSPRGMVWADGTMYVQHPPFVRAFHDDDRDGVADRNEVLVDGIGFDLKFRGADHTTNGMQLGIDGWLYVAVGDYGFLNAKGTDGASVQLHGGGVVRVRPDGSGLEVVSRGQRNIYDVAVSPTLDLFTRDNTNDGDGWDVRLSHVVHTGHYGYPSLFKHFPDEIVQPLAIYGGGSPTGSVYLNELGLPGGLGRSLYTCDWGRNTVYRHPLQASGASFKAEQEVFLELPRPIDMEVDGQSRLYVASWRNGGFNYGGPDVGYVVQVVNPEHQPAPVPDLKRADLLAELRSDSHVRRLAAQREILRGDDGSSHAGPLEALALGDASIESRVAAIFTLAQVRAPGWQDALIRISAAEAVRAFALRALADDIGAAAEVPAGPFVAALSDANPRVRLQAAVALGRLGKAEAIEPLIPLVADADPVVAHTAINALVALKAVEPCFAAIDRAQTSLIPGLMRVLQAQHDPRVVDSLIQRLDRTTDPSLRRSFLRALARLVHREAVWESGWWGTRPDTSGPYFNAVTWEESDRILEALRKSLAAADPATLRFLLVELQRHKVGLPEATPILLDLAAKDVSFRTVATELLVDRPKLPPEAVPLLADAAGSAAQDAGLRARALGALYRSGNQEGIDAAVGVLAVLGEGDDVPAELARAREDFLRDARHAGRVDYFRQLAVAPTVGNPDEQARRELGFGVLLQVATSRQSPAEAAIAAAGAIEEGWSRPDTTTALLRAIGRGKSETYAYQVKAHLADDRPAVRTAAAAAAAHLDLSDATGDAPDKVTIATLPYEQTLAAATAAKGDVELGERLFLTQGCIACHTVAKSEPPKGPYLGGIGQRYSRSELIESIVKPNAKIAQGFVTHYFVTKKRERIDGFIVREAGDEVEVRNVAGVSVVLKNADVIRKGTLQTSIMPEALTDNLTPHALASLAAYLESLKAE